MDTLDEKLVHPDPIIQFQSWFDYAREQQLPMPEAMTLATADAAGKPSARMVLLKQVDERGFTFFTNYTSGKAEELTENPRAALVFFWSQLERQVRVEGTVTRISGDESCEYFHTRPRESQLGAWASPQSKVISGREELERRYAEVEEKYRDREVECPEHWGGFLVTPVLIEFWKGRVGRLHDRIVYERVESGWSIKRLAP